MALCKPRPNTPLMVALVRGLVQLGERPSLEVVRALAEHFLTTRDAQSATVRELRLGADSWRIYQRGR